MIYELDIFDATQWIAHTDWLGNPANSSTFITRSWAEYTS